MYILLTMIKEEKSYIWEGVATTKSLKGIVEGGNDVNTGRFYRISKKKWKNKWVEGSIRGDKRTK